MKIPPRTLETVPLVVFAATVGWLSFGSVATFLLTGPTARAFSVGVAVALMSVVVNPKAHPWWRQAVAVAAVLYALTRAAVLFTTGPTPAAGLLWVYVALTLPALIEPRGE